MPQLATMGRYAKCSAAHPAAAGAGERVNDWEGDGGGSESE